MEEINRIRRTKNKYEILGVPKDATEDDVKRAYKKLVLKTHPDKNPGSAAAEEAFKKVNEAYATISDKAKRRTYDTYGDEGLQREQSGGSARGTPFQNGQSFNFNDPDLDEFFSNFFTQQGPRGASFHTHTFNAGGNRRRRQPTHEEAQRQKVGQLMQLVPILLFLLLWMFMSSPPEASGPSFSLSYKPDSGNTAKRRTKRHNIEYYVHPGARMDRMGAARLRDFEEEVLQSKRSDLSRQCKFEKKEKYHKRQRADTYYDGEDRERLRRQADEAPTDACNKLQEINRKYVRGG